jgi:hypothetical protein
MFMLMYVNLTRICFQDGCSFMATETYDVSFTTNVKSSFTCASTTSDFAMYPMIESEKAATMNMNAAQEPFVLGTVASVFAGYPSSVPFAQPPNIPCHSEQIKPEARASDKLDALEPPDYIFGRWTTSEPSPSTNDVQPDEQPFGRLSSWYNPVEIAYESSSCGTPSDDSSPPHSPTNHLGETIDAYSTSAVDAIEAAPPPNFYCAQAAGNTWAGVRGGQLVGGWWM